MNERVLLVEDDETVSELVSTNLERTGFRVTTESDGRRGLQRFQEGPFDLVLLDVMLPSLDGFEICRHIRRDSMIPIVMLSAKTDVVDVVVGLESGADDYVKKPFEVRELIARVRAALRRAAPDKTDSPITVGDLEIDPFAFRVRKAGNELSLTATEFRLLCEMARNAGQVLSRETLLDRVWGYDYLGDSRLVDMAVKRLRDKIEDDPRNPSRIATVRGVGYRLDQG